MKKIFILFALVSFIQIPVFAQESPVTQDQVSLIPSMAEMHGDVCNFVCGPRYDYSEVRNFYQSGGQPGLTCIDNSLDEIKNESSLTNDPMRMTCSERAGSWCINYNQTKGGVNFGLFVACAGNLPDGFQPAIGTTEPDPSLDTTTSIEDPFTNGVDVGDEYAETISDSENDDSIVNMLQEDEASATIDMEGVTIPVEYANDMPDIPRSNPIAGLMGMFGVIGIISIVIPLIVLFLIIFWIKMLIRVIKSDSEHKALWIIAMVLGSVIGSTAYYFVEGRAWKKQFDADFAAFRAMRKAQREAAGQGTDIENNIQPSTTPEPKKTDDIQRVQFVHQSETDTQDTL